MLLNFFSIFMSLVSQPNWFARSVSSAVFTPALLVSLVGLTLWWLGLGSTAIPEAKSPFIALTLLAVAMGYAALAWVRPQRVGLSPPHIMLSLGFGGMMLGLFFDVLNASTARLQSLCLQSSDSGFIESLTLHMEFLPGMHVGMLAGGLLAIPSLRLLRPHCGRYLCSLFAQNLMCSAWMLVGMTAGALWLTRLQMNVGSLSPTGMLGGMFVGMTWGMVISVALYRVFFSMRNRT